MNVNWPVVIPAGALAALAAAHPAWAGAAADVFTGSGPGVAIVHLLLLAAFGTLASYVVSALGSGQVASMVKLVTVFGCLGLVVNVIWGAISSIAKVFGVSL